MPRILFPVMVSGRQGELLDRYGPSVILAVSVAMILGMMFFIFFQCRAISRDKAGV